MASIPYIPSITVDSVIEALGAFLQPFVGADTPIIRGQVNRAAPPLPAYVELTEIGNSDLETSATYNNLANNQIKIVAKTKITIQIDFYGPSSGDWCQAVRTVYRTPYAPDQFPNGISPLFCDDGHQVPLVTGEEQYETRWIMTAFLQYNPSVSLPQQSAATLTVNEIEDLP